MRERIARLCFRAGRWLRGNRADIAGPGDDLGSDLIKVFGLPDKTIGFSLHFRVDDVPVVKCESYIDSLNVDERGEIVRRLHDYRLEKIEDPEAVQ